MCFRPFLGGYDGSLFRGIPTVTLESCWQSPFYEDPSFRKGVSENIFYSSKIGVCLFSVCQHHGPDHLLKVSSVNVKYKQIIGGRVFHTQQCCF